jgi:ABC-type Fe3+ transport system permease subunit
LAIIFTWGSGGDSLWMILVATILLIIGIGALWNEYWLKKRHNSRYSITSILR